MFTHEYIIFSKKLNLRMLISIGAVCKIMLACLRYTKPDLELQQKAFVSRSRKILSVFRFLLSELFLSLATPFTCKWFSLDHAFTIYGVTTNISLYENGFDVINLSMTHLFHYWKQLGLPWAHAVHIGLSVSLRHSRYTDNKL